MSHPLPLTRLAGRVVDVVAVCEVGILQDGWCFRGVYETNAKNGYGLVFRV
jgi:hypothetical protein